MKKSLVGVALLGTLLATTGAVCRNSSTPPSAYTLSYWTVYTDADAINPVIEAYQAKYPYIDVEVKKFRPDEYEDKLIEGWAKGEGPDIFSLPNNHIGSFIDLIEPLPAVLKTTAVTTEKTLFSTDTVVTKENLASTSPQEVRALFPQVVFDDVVKSTGLGSNVTSSVYGLPMSLDTLVLYYNKTILDRTNIAVPAVTWEDFVKQVRPLLLEDVDHNIIQAAVGLGTSNNVPHMFDIVSLLMMQNGAVMTEGDQVTFADSERRGETSNGAKAVEFYTSFSNPKADSYSWTTEQPSALENFIAGKSAYYIGYFYDLATIQDEGSDLNFDIAPLPQITPDSALAVNYANYWVETVSVNSTHPDAAWAFVEALTTNEANVSTILETTKQPAALRTLLEGQKEDFTLATFANQALTAQSWYAGKEPIAVEQAFADMIDAVNEARLDADTAVANTAEAVQLTYE